MFLNEAQNSPLLAIKTITVKLKSLNIRGQLTSLESPLVMGILNITPDSFYAGSRVGEMDKLLQRAEKMVNDGATFLDVGGYSSRPGATDISPEEEVDRVVEPIRELAGAFPDTILSIDTFRSQVAVAAVNAGAHMVNDISGGHLDSDMHAAVGEMQVPYVGMHMRGTAQTMKSLTSYQDLLTDIGEYFSVMVESLSQRGVKDIILDPGFGFAKTVDQNFHLLASLEYFRFFGLPILVGLSRKSMIYKTLENTPDNALNGTTVLNTVALQKGASILRVHDVEEAVEVVELTKRLIR